MFFLETFIWITEKKHKIENQQLFDGTTDITLFNGVERLHINATMRRN